MVRISTVSWVTTLLLVTRSMAQSNDPFASLVSEGYSIFTAVTSILPSVASAASAAAASSSAAAASAASNAALTTSGSSSTTSSTSASAASSTSSTSRNSASNAAASASRASSSSSAAASASAASESASNSHSGGGHNNLAIILGCVLGALALGLLLLALLFCCRRRRRRSRDSLRSQALSPSAEEFESWRQPNTFNGHHGTHNKEVLGAGAMGAPLMTEHPAFRDSHDEPHRNPFVPVPPPPRRRAQNSRTGLTDGTVQGDPPYLMNEKTMQPIGRKSNDSHHAAGALAAGAGGAALGAAAMHHHNKNREKGFDEKHGYDQDYQGNRSSMVNRKPVPSNVPVGHSPDAAAGHNPNAYPTPSTNDDAFALNRTRRSSMDSARNRPSRDATRANAVFDRQYSSSSSDERHHSHLGTGAALGAGALGGAALAHHRRKSHSHSPHRNSHLARDHGDNSDSSNSREYADAVPHQLHNVPIAQPAQQHAHTMAGGIPSNPHDISSSGYNIPPTPPTRSRRNSALGTGAPAAAATAAYIGHPHSRSRSRSRSTSMDNDFRPPAVPSRSPHRSSFTGARADLEQGPEAKGIVGDNGYPHMGVPRRKSGGADDYAGVPTASAMAGGTGNDRYAPASHEPSDDSTWRLSQGMPGGWQRSHSPAQRYSMDSAKRMSSPISPVDGRDGGGWNQRDSLMSGSTAVGGGRLRLADLRREEEERANMHGRQSMGSEWTGNGGYGGYDDGGYGGHHPQHHHGDYHQGVGQAM